MTEERRRMSNEERAELIGAIESGAIRNASEYARVFAARHDLNPQTVRTTISRLRRQLGLLEHRTGRANYAAGSEWGGRLSEWGGRLREAGDRVNAIALLNADEVTDPRLVRLAAAALIRYELDETFRRAVDQERPEVEKVYRRLTELRESAENLSLEERGEILRLLGPS